MRHSIYPRANLYNETDRKGAVVSLDATVHRIRTGEKGLAENTQQLRDMLSKGQSKAYRKRKAEILPAATFSGIFSTRDRDVALPDKFTEHTGIKTYDIDGIKRSDIPAIKVILSLDPYIFLVFTSPSFEGLKAFERVDPIPTTANDIEHKHVWALGKARLDEKLNTYGYQCDSGNDPTRLCFLAYDPDVYYKPNKPTRLWDREAYHIEHQQKEREQSQKRQQQRTYLENQQWDNTDIDPTALKHINPDSIHYDDWFRIIAACKASGLSWHDVDAWSRQGTKHVEGDIEKRWHGINTAAISWGTVIYFAQQNGYQLPERKRPPKLQNAAPSDTTEKSLDRNRADRERAADKFLDTETDALLDILLVKDSTGSGKSHTMLAKSNAHGKRTIMNPPHNALAAQAIEMAFEHGYTNPFHFLGREHNWEKSGIAKIPVKMRTEALFAKNNCIMLDEVEKYTRKRLAPRTYCEHKCGFKSECAHMAQYKGLGERDFIASCTPGLLFDLNMRGYLELLIKSKPEITDEDLAMDAMLGTESEDWKAFDFAILDDYTVSGLYTDISFTQSEFKVLKKVWHGTPTGTFAKGMLKAFGKKKPQKIIKALRKALDESAEHHDEIAESLTKHVRIGTVKALPSPKGSKESKRLLAKSEILYEDGGRHFIPVDKEAYTELKKKGYPSVNPDLLKLKDTSVPVHIPVAPVTALMSGVQVQDLTPVWQKGATPIDLIQILLGSIGNDKNAPISRSFRTGETPVAVLTFSIPPQAPVGVIPQIAMLSATSDQTDTKNAFAGQSVQFSEHDGKEIDFANGVKVFQYQDARLTSGSVFEYPTDANGKRLLQENPTGLTQTASERITKLNGWAKREDGRTAFISYKDFTELFQDTLDGFDTVTHFDKVAGLNFDGLKFLVVFGYPKVKHEVVMEQARRQYGSDEYPLPEGTYEELTETKEWGTNGLTIYESQYLDTRLEKIRHQLSTEKLEQAIGRARLPAWTDTTTIIFTNAPVSGITQRATLFTAQAFNGADSPSAIADAMQQIADAEQSGDVQAVMETKGVSQRQAYTDTQSAREKQKADRDARILQLHNTGISQRAIEIVMKDEGHEKVSNGTIRNVINEARKNCSHL